MDESTGMEFDNSPEIIATRWAWMVAGAALFFWSGWVLASASYGAIMG